MLRVAEEIALRDGPAAALRYLGGSKYAGTEAVVRRMHELVWTNRTSLPEELLAEPFLDTVWSQCDACTGTWLVPPSAVDERLILEAPGQVGGRCPDCGRVMCAECARLTGARCVCMAARLDPLGRPTGRVSRAEPASAEARATTLEPEVGDARPWDLYYHRFAWPTAVDPGFPCLASASPPAHLRWGAAPDGQRAVSAGGTAA